MADHSALLWGIVLISIWFFGLSMLLTFMSNDPLISEITHDSIDTSTINASQYFNTTEPMNPKASSTGFISMTLRMFTFKIPSEIMPQSFNVLISFINWILLIVMIVCIYRIANPLS